MTTASIILVAGIAGIFVALLLSLTAVESHQRIAWRQQVTRGDRGVQCCPRRFEAGARPALQRPCAHAAAEPVRRNRTRSSLPPTTPNASDSAWTSPGTPQAGPWTASHP